MKRREFIKTIGGGALAVGALMLMGNNKLFGLDKDKKPNFLFIITDQQNSGALSIAGNQYIKTPNMDRIAENGVRFVNSFCTFPLCSPSRSSLFTSRMPHEVGINSNKKAIIPDNISTMGTLFSKAGYKTAYAGKWHLPASYPTYEKEGSPYQNIPGFEVLPLEGEWVKKNLSDNGKGMTVDVHTTDAAIKFLKDRHDSPFLLVMSILNPHDICEYIGYPEIFSKIDPGNPLPPVVPNLNATEDEPEIISSQRSKKKYLSWTDDQWRRYRGSYYRLTEMADSHVGRVMKVLDESGLASNTIIIFTADHGECMGAHKLIHKMKFYEESLAVPMIISIPGSSVKGIVDNKHMITGLDILPTMCDLADIKKPSSFEGLSLKPVLEGKNPDWRNYVISEVGDNKARGRMVRTKRNKYVVYENGSNPEQLFDLEEDPYETKNLIGDPSFKAEARELKDKLAAFIKSTGDTFVIPSGLVQEKNMKKYKKQP